MSNQSDSEHIDSRKVELEALKYFSARLRKAREAIDKHLETPEQIPAKERAILATTQAILKPTRDAIEDVRDEIDWYIGNGNRAWSSDREQQDEEILKRYKRKATYGGPAFY